MTKPRDYVLFLHGRYRADELPFYRRLCKKRRRVAVDGGYSFFRKSGLFPHALIGDFDSLKTVPRGLSKRTEILTFPVRKDRTDSHLALDFCIEREARDVDIVSPDTGDVDHFLGNVMLLTLAARATPPLGRTRIINAAYEIVCAHDERLAFVRRAGDGLSVLPLSASIRLSCSGMDYDAQNLRIRQGESCGLRNVVTASQAWVEVAGKALIVRRFRG